MGKRNCSSILVLWKYNTRCGWQTCLDDFKDGKLLVGTEEIPFVKLDSQSEPSCSRVLLKECVDVPPCSAMVVMAMVEGRLGAAKWGLVEAETTTCQAADGSINWKNYCEFGKGIYSLAFDEHIRISSSD